MADANSSDKNELIEPDQIDYGSTTEEEIPTKSLEEMYTIIGNSNNLSSRKRTVKLSLPKLLSFDM